MEIPEDRDVTAEFHLAAGSQWLTATDEGRNTNALVYCGFEFRLALERVSLELLIHIRRDEPFTEADIKALNKPNNLRNHIYKLIGNQQRINRQVEFINILMDVFEQPFRVSSVDLRKLVKYWSECSELCHMQLSKQHVWEVEEVRKNAYNTLLEIRDFLTDTLSGLTWFKVYDYFHDMQEQFVNGTVTKEEVIYRLKETGVFATVTMPDGTRHILPGFAPGSHLEDNDDSEPSDREDSE